MDLEPYIPIIAGAVGALIGAVAAALILKRSHEKKTRALIKIAESQEQRLNLMREELDILKDSFSKSIDLQEQRLELEKKSAQEQQIINVAKAFWELLK